MQPKADRIIFFRHFHVLSRTPTFYIGADHFTFWALTGPGFLLSGDEIPVLFLSLIDWICRIYHQVAFQGYLGRILDSS